MSNLVEQLESFDAAIEESEKAELQHKSAFRKVYEFLKRQYPPRWDEQYWLTAVTDFANTIGSEPDNKLLGDMMLCVYEYLGTFLKEQREHSGSVMKDD